MTDPVMSEHIRELVTFINRWPAQPNVWKRFRVAMTREEVESFKAFIKAEGNSNSFILAVRGVPIEIEAHPTDPMYYSEAINGR